MTLDKLPGIRGDLVRTNHLWESWNFLKLCQALRLWTRRDPLDSSEKTNYAPRRRETSNKLFNAQQREPKQRGCVYCDDTSHVPLKCPADLHVVHAKADIILQFVTERGHSKN